MERPRSTTRTLPPDSATRPLILPAEAPARGRALPAPPRREGPEKLTGLAKYADDLVFPGAWYGATIRSTERTPCCWASTWTMASTGAGS